MIVSCVFFFFKQKTAYEISACLVGSEMCIRDRYVGQPLTKVLSRRTSERIKHDKNFVDEDDKIGLGNSKIPVLLSAHTIENEGGGYTEPSLHLKR